MKNLLYSLWFFIGLITISISPLLAQATVSDYQFATQQQAKQFSSITHELRCLVCQDEDLWNSQAKLAADLREQVANMIKAGRSNQEIKTYMVARYGDFVLFKPPLNIKTVLLWSGPFVAILLGALIMLGLIRKNSRRKLPSLSDVQKEKLKHMK